MPDLSTCTLKVVTHDCCDMLITCPMYNVRAIARTNANKACTSVMILGFVCVDIMEWCRIFLKPGQNQCQF